VAVSIIPRDVHSRQRLLNNVVKTPWSRLEHRLTPDVIWQLLSSPLWSWIRSVVPCS
jgi:hypothetical protein